MTNKVEAPPIGTVLAGKYRLDRRVGKGGMGVVFEARHLLLENQVAIKVLTDREPATVTRFLNEARAAARLKSDYVVSVSDVGTDDGVPYMVMELLEGEDLGEMANRRGAMPCDEVVDYIVQVLAGLADAHALGIVHRDLKPGNLFVTWRGGHPDRVKILDFGISKRLWDEGGPKITTGSSVLGSPAYMAPEQLRGESDVDGRTDLWAVGVLLYELLTGDLPFNGPNAGAVFAAILETEPRPPSMVRPELPVGIDEVVLKCLRRKQAERFGTAGEVADALAPFCSESGRRNLELLRKKVPGFGISLVPMPVEPRAPESSLPPTTRARASSPSSRKASVLVLLALVLVGLLGVAVGIGLPRAPAPWVSASPPDPASSTAVVTTTPPPPQALRSSAEGLVLGEGAALSASAAEATSVASPSSSARKVKPRSSASAKVIDEDAIFRRH